MADRLCPATESAPAEPARVAGCAKAWCTAAADERLCVCENASREPDGDLRHEHLRIAADGRVVQRWPAEVSPMLGPQAFSLLLADVDGDGRSDWLVVQHMGVSNGMGVAYANLCTWLAAAAGKAPVCRAVEDWGALSVLLQEPGRVGCSLLDAAWEPGSEPRRGEGTYALGRVWRHQHGAWQAVPLSERALLARRLLRSFERDRERLPVLNRKRLWTQHPDARAVACPDPLCEGRSER
jgi:hypothetical protein